MAAMSLLLAHVGWAASKYKILHAFGASHDGAGLWCSLVQDKSLNLYGTTSGGGAYGYGTVFELVAGAGGRWDERVLRNMANGDPKGDEPNGGLILDPAGNLYGTTLQGGPRQNGVVFELTVTRGGWKDTVLHAGGSWASVVMDGAGRLYGTTETNVFELIRGSHGWNKTVLHRFVTQGDGDGAFAPVILDASGNLYGTTKGGGIGTRCGGNGCGTVYELRPTQSGWEEKIVHDFTNDGKDGAVPGWGALFMDAKGSLYGTTASGGCCGGVVFKLTPQTDGRWKETILYEFPGGTNGFEPNAGVVMDKAGNLYGTTDYGGDPNCGCGIIYKLSPGPKGKWTYTVLHEFGIGNDGGVPEGNLVIDSQGNLYGGTVLGGTYGGGVVFELTP